MTAKYTRSGAAWLAVEWRPPTLRNGIDFRASARVQRVMTHTALLARLLALSLGALLSPATASAQPQARDVRFRADSLFSRGLAEDNGKRSPRQVRDLQESLRLVDFKDGFQREYLRYIAAKLGLLDIAFAQVDTLLAQGWLDLDNTFNFASDNVEMMADARWPALERRVVERQRALLATMSPASFGLDPQRMRLEVGRIFDDSRRAIPELFGALRSPELYATPTRRGAWMLTTQRVPGASSVVQDVVFFIWVPASYRRDRPHPAVLWSHQGWFYNPAPSAWTKQRNIFDNPFWWQASAHDAVQIVPMMSRTLDGSTALGQQALREILVHTKQLLNLDDDRIVIAGHSNGGSTAFRAMAESASPFAGAITMNGWPDPGIAMRNWSNRTLHSWSGELDAMFPSTDVTALHGWAQSVGAAWTLRVVPRADHGIRRWIPDEWPAVERAWRALRRDPFAARRVVQSIDLRATTIDWLGIDRVDTSRARAEWHHALATPSVATAGDGARGSPAGSVRQDAMSALVEGRFADNVFDLRSSRAARLSVLVSPEMVDLARPVVVRINGEERHNAIVKPDLRLMRSLFVSDFDRRAIWVARLSFDVAAP